MPDIGTAPRSSSPQRLMSGWISRLDLALELGVTVETLHRWEKIRFGPPCVRAGRKIYYRRDAVRDGMRPQEAQEPRRAVARTARTCVRRRVARTNGEPCSRG